MNIREFVRIFPVYLVSAMMLALMAGCGGGGGGGGGQSNTPPDTTPNSFSFKDVSNAERATVVTSNSITITGIDSPTSITISGGSYSINNGVFNTAAGTVSNNAQVKVQHTTSASYNTKTNTILTVGGVSDTFTSTTRAQIADTTPNQFTFQDISNVERSTLVTSGSVTISGINSPTSISISGGQYSINNGTFTSTNGTINNNDNVRVQHTTSGNFDTATTTTLTVGGVSASFTARTKVAAKTFKTSISNIDLRSISTGEAITNTSATYDGYEVTVE